MGSSILMVYWRLCGVVSVLIAGQWWLADAVEEDAPVILDLSKPWPGRSSQAEADYKLLQETPGMEGPLEKTDKALAALKAKAKIMKESYRKQETQHAEFMGSLNPIGSNRPVQSETDAQVLHFKGLDATEPGNENVADQNKTHPSLVLPQKLSAEREAETKNELKEKTETKRKIEAQKDQGAVANPDDEEMFDY